MKTYFAPAERVAADELAAEIAFASDNPIMVSLLHSISGLLAIIDEHRQVIALNDPFLKLLGIEQPEKVLGLRPGEVLDCIHADGEPAGCGTTKY